MARSGTGYFDRKGNFFKSPRDATLSDLATLFGQIGDRESLAPGIANVMLERRKEIEALFAEHDVMMAEAQEATVREIGSKVSAFPKLREG